MLAHGERVTVKRESCVVSNCHYRPYLLLAEQRLLGAQEQTASTATLGYLPLMLLRARGTGLCPRGGAQHYREIVSLQASNPNPVRKNREVRTLGHPARQPAHAL